MKDKQSGKKTRPLSCQDSDIKKTKNRYFKKIEVDRTKIPEFAGIGEKGLVSIIIPTYNRSGLILETLESVFQQTYRLIEIVIVDDGSTDDTELRVRQWAASHQHAF